MLYKITFWFIRRAFAKSVATADHGPLTRQIFLILHESLQKHFWEDNIPTTQAFLEENMERVLTDVLKAPKNQPKPYIYL